MSDALSDLERLISGMGEEEKAELDKLIAVELAKPWLPTPGPQAEAYYSKADLLLYGGAAGGGKTDLILGLSLTAHNRSVIFRRAYGDLKGIEQRLLEILPDRRGYAGSPHPILQRDGLLIEMGALEKPGAENDWQGRAHDLICFDEGAQLSEAKVHFVMGWNRSTKPNQRCRVVIASNPPLGGDGDWLIEWFAPWLDPLFPNPAKDGELRWAINVDDETIWCDGPETRTIKGEDYQAKSRTFIPARLDDNPYLKDTGYRASIQNMPEPMRSALLKGDFLAGRADHEWQVIPTEWLRLSNERWKAAKDKKRLMIALAADIALGSGDDNVLARLYEDAWFGEPVSFKGADLVGAADVARIPAEIAHKILTFRRDGADLSADCTGGWGSGVRSSLKTHHDIDCAAIIFSAGSTSRTKDGKFGFRNLRAEMHWKLREALDPEGGEDIALPPHPRLTAELTAPRYKIRGTDILIEEKDEIKKRVGSSPDMGDAYVMAWHRRVAAIKAIERRAKPKAKPKIYTPSPNGWMA